MKDRETISKISKAIVDRWGREVAERPADTWNRNKEAVYLEQLKALEKKRKSHKKEEQVLVNGILLPKKLFTKDREQNRICGMCKKYSLRYADDLYMNKYNVCEKCYIEHLEDRLGK